MPVDYLSKYYCAEYSFLEDFAPRCLETRLSHYDDFLDVSTASQARNVTNWFTLIDSTLDVCSVKQKLVLGEC
ncbi:hypothetical protein [Nostoc sp. FACHB-145]|uniref:hypothetical protein n=1 Tax=Nostoc sp. FACHB-145 TaxID=2692836 RepID=UPI00168718C2|nr:hypothetical protein [Nostoc sp. FACHB-145]MBD2472173.1 hypothetical protein [Nostoc sp. FACHB-145]